LGDLITGIICFVLAKPVSGAVWTQQQTCLASYSPGACLIETALFWPRLDSVLDTEASG